MDIMMNDLFSYFRIFINQHITQHNINYELNSEESESILNFTHSHSARANVKSKIPGRLEWQRTTEIIFFYINK